ncbi:sensor histidine kinase [Caulobacter sp. 17J80-11]|uniref:sensor histidine kinase n=1 Tax=Caulobacter sp. 17J80-11 TaxID=2763502 RepID=UPI00165390F2|nr:GAF domain-containing protein [Caulobacter sp. 17J80-11]MBC6980188.1 GAF domain-containing protein [Caulobacter sp. 17J80-11]
MPDSRSSMAAASLAKVRCHQTILVDFARVAAESTDLQRLLDLACEHAARAVGVSHAKVLQYRADKGDLLMVAGRGWREGVVGHARLGSDMMSPPGRAFQTRATVSIGNLLEEGGFRPSKVLKEHGIVSLLNAPIGVNGVVWGVLELDAPEPDAFDDDDECFLMACSMILALAVRHRQAQSEREHTAERLAKRVSQADTLLSEQNHRVRNYFQLILAILANRSRKAANDQARADLADVMERVTAVALAHDQLAFREGGSTHVQAADYIDALCLSMERSLEGELRIERDLEPLELRADRAVPMGLILNELLTNALKYAVKGHPSPSLSVRFVSDVGTKDAMLAVRDNGQGMGDKRTGAMGLKLVELLANQLSGRIEVDSSSAGTEVRLTFPLVE